MADRRALAGERGRCDTWSPARPFALRPKRPRYWASSPARPAPFHDLHLAQSSSLFRTTTSFTGTVDLTCGLACFGDPQLQQALGRQLGSTRPSSQQAGHRPGPGRHLCGRRAACPAPCSHPTPRCRTGRQSVWPIPLGTRASLATAPGRPATTVVLEAGIGIAAVVVVAIGAVLWWVLRRRRRRRGPAGATRGPWAAARSQALMAPGPSVHPAVTPAVLG